MTAIAIGLATMLFLVWVVGAVRSLRQAWARRQAWRCKVCRRHLTSVPRGTEIGVCCSSKEPPHLPGWCRSCCPEHR